MLPKVKILFIGGFGNPIASAWWHGLSGWGNAAFVDTSGIPHTPDRLRTLALPMEAVLYEASAILQGDIQANVRRICQGSPDIIVGWWGGGIIPSLEILHTAFPAAKTCLIVDTWPNASSFIPELREVSRYNSARFVDSYITYSEYMTRALRKYVIHAKRKPILAMIEPFPVTAFSNGHEPSIKLVRDERRALIFTGRSDLLFCNETKYKKDAVGPHLLEIVRRGVRVFVHEKAQVDPVLGLETYPEFTNQEILDGTFSNYVSQFDGHLCIYNEFNSTICRRVQTGLSTRLAQAMTAEAPIIASSSSKFLEDVWGEKPFGFLFSSTEELVSKIKDSKALSNYRANIKEHRLFYSMQGQSNRLRLFLEDVLCIST